MRSPELGSTFGYLGNIPVGAATPSSPKKRDGGGASPRLERSRFSRVEIERLKSGTYELDNSVGCQSAGFMVGGTGCQQPGHAFRQVY